MDNIINQENFPSGKRREPRIDYPCHILINDKKIQTLDWSLGGFGIEDGLLGEDYKNPQTMTLIIDLYKTELRLEVTAQAIRFSQHGYAIGFKFVELDDFTQTTLNNVIDSYFNSEKITLENAVKQGVKGKLIESDKARIAANKGKLFGLIVTVFTLAALTVFLVYKLLFVIDSPYAAVVQKSISIDSNVTGKLDLNNLKNGVHVDKGQVLFQLASNEQSSKRQEKESELQILDIEIKKGEIDLKHALEVAESYKTRLKTEIDVIKSQINNKQSEVNTLHQQYKLLSKKYSQGVIDNLTKTDVYVEYFAKRSELLQLKKELALHLNYQEQYVNQVFPQDEISDQENIKQIESQLNYNKEKRDILRAQLNKLNETTAYSSPCDCIVQQINAYSGLITIHKPILRLLPINDATPFIYALIPLDKAQHITIGDDASFYLANLKQKQHGHVSDIKYLSSHSDEILIESGVHVTGLPKNLPEGTQFGLVKIMPENTLSYEHFAQPATVRIHQGVMSFLTKAFSI